MFPLTCLQKDMTILIANIWLYSSFFIFYLKNGFGIDFIYTCYVMFLVLKELSADLDLKGYLFYILVDFSFFFLCRVSPYIFPSYRFS